MKNENDKPKYWIARSIVDEQDMNQLFADHGIWYANSGEVVNQLHKITEGDFIALVRTPNTIHALGQVYAIKTAHKIGNMAAGGRGSNDLHVFFMKPMDGKGYGWTKVEQKAPYTVLPSVQKVSQAYIKGIWGIWAVA